MTMTSVVLLSYLIKSSPYLIICHILQICTETRLSNNMVHQVPREKMWAWSSMNYGHSYHLPCQEILILSDCWGDAQGGKQTSLSHVATVHHITHINSVSRGIRK